MRVAIVAESFLPNVNGVVNSVLRVLEYLRREGHEAVVIAPGARDRQEEIFTYEGFRIVRVPTVEVPGINSLPIGVPLPTVLTELSRFRPDVVHLASPFVLGAAGAFAAKTLNVPAWRSTRQTWRASPTTTSSRLWLLRCGSGRARFITSAR